MTRVESGLRGASKIARGTFDACDTDLMHTDKGPAAPLPTRLRGREDELDLIRSQVLVLGQGRASVTVIEGPPGSGKTRLLAEAIDIARGRGILVASGGAARGDRVVPMGALLNSLVGGTAPLLDPASFRDLRTLPELRYWLTREIEEMLERLASDRAGGVDRKSGGEGKRGD